MKKSFLIIVLVATMLSMGFSSCKKMFCKCQATGYTTQSHLNTILERHASECISIAETGPIYDDGVLVTCSY